MKRKPRAEIAEQFGLNPGTLRNLASKVHKSGTLGLLNPRLRSRRGQWIPELRLKENLFNKEIPDRTLLQGSVRIMYGQ